MRNMFNIKFNKASWLFLLAMGLITSTSCDKDVTELQPFDRITETLAFETPARIELSMVGVYDAAQSGFYAGGQVRGYPFGAANVQQGDNRGEDVLNVAAFYAITYESTYDPTTANNVFMWHTLYGVINKANIFIQGIQAALANGVVTAEQAAAYEGEARFLRALAHHELLVHYARPYADDPSSRGVFYRTAPISSLTALQAEQTKNRLSVGECYNLLLEDLNYAEQNLPATRAGGLKITRATKGAAIAIKSRIYLHMGQWSNVITEGNKIVTGAGYSLTPSPDGVFVSNSNNSESIFSIENAATDNPGVNGALPAMYAVAPGRALVAISPNIYNVTWWLENDLRRQLLVSEAANGFFSKKYRDVTNQSDYNPIVRLAEVILNVAEAHARLGNTEEALEMLNMVRNRAVTNPEDQFVSGDFSSQNELILAILRERRIEFLSEGRRWSDIHRLGVDPNFNTGGIPAKVAFGNTTKASWGYGLNVDANGDYIGTKSIVARPYSDFKFIWPIPLDEINTNPGGSSVQNPGY